MDLGRTSETSGAPEAEPTERTPARSGWESGVPSRAAVDALKRHFDDLEAEPPEDVPVDSVESSAWRWDGNGPVDRPEPPTPDATGNKLLTDPTPDPTPEEDWTSEDDAFDR